jgi:hypothetical protein
MNVYMYECKYICIQVYVLIFTYIDLNLSTYTLRYATLYICIGACSLGTDVINVIKDLQNQRDLSSVYLIYIHRSKLIYIY